MPPINDQNIFDIWDKIWASISKNEKDLAVTCHEIKDLKEDIGAIREKIGKVEGKYDTLIKSEIEKQQVINNDFLQKENIKSDRKHNIRLVILGGIFTLIVALLEIVPMLLQ